MSVGSHQRIESICHWAKYIKDTALNPILELRELLAINGLEFDKKSRTIISYVMKNKLIQWTPDELKLLNNRLASSFDDEKLTENLPKESTQVSINILPEENKRIGANKRQARLYNSLRNLRDDFKRVFKEEYEDLGVEFVEVALQASILDRAKAAFDLDPHWLEQILKNQKIHDYLTSLVKKKNDECKRLGKKTYLERLGELSEEDRESFNDVRQEMHNIRGFQERTASADDWKRLTSTLYETWKKIPLGSKSITKESYDQALPKIVTQENIQTRLNDLSLPPRDRFQIMIEMSLGFYDEQTQIPYLIYPVKVFDILPYLNLYFVNIRSLGHLERIVSFVRKWKHKVEAEILTDLLALVEETTFNLPLEPVHSVLARALREKLADENGAIQVSVRYSKENDPFSISLKAPEGDLDKPVLGDFLYDGYEHSKRIREFFDRYLGLVKHDKNIFMNDYLWLESSLDSIRSSTDKGLLDLAAIALVNFYKFSTFHRVFDRFHERESTGSRKSYHLDLLLRYFQLASEQTKKQFSAQVPQHFQPVRMGMLVGDIFLGLFLNIMDNAIKHADSTVSVKLHLADGSLSVEVSNDLKKNHAADELITHIQASKQYVDFDISRAYFKKGGLFFYIYIANKELANNFALDVKTTSDNNLIVNLIFGGI